MDENSVQKDDTLEGAADTRNGVKRMIFVVISILLEVAIVYLFNVRFVRYAIWASALAHLVAAGAVLFIFGQHKTPSVKMPWIMLIMAFPVFGLTLYLLIGLNGSTRRMRLRYDEVDRQLLHAIAGDDAADAQWFPGSYTETGILAIGSAEHALEKDAKGNFLAFDHDRILRDAIRKCF